MSENKITVYDKLELDIIDLESMNASLDFDIETSDGEQECRKHLKKLRKVWNGIEKLRKAAKADYIAKGKEVDIEARSFQDRVDAMHQLHSDPLKDKEAREQAEIEKIAAANKLKAEIEEAEREAHLENGERELAAQQKAMQAKADELKAEEERMANEKRIAEAAEQARIDAEAKAEQDKKEAAAKAEQDKKDAVEKAEREAKAAADKIEADRIKAEEEKKAEQARLAQIEADRVADKEHRETVEIAIIDELKKIIDHSGLAGEVMDAIRSGKIPNVSIQY